jgi:hypothetical protein
MFETRLLIRPRVRLDEERKMRPCHRPICLRRPQSQSTQAYKVRPVLGPLAHLEHVRFLEAEEEIKNSLPRRDTLYRTRPIYR